MDRFDFPGEIVSVTANSGPGTDNMLPIPLVDQMAPSTRRLFIESITAQNMDGPNGTDQLSIAIYRNGVQVWPVPAYLQMFEVSAFGQPYPVGIELNGGRIQVMAKNISGSSVAGHDDDGAAIRARASLQARLV